MCVFVSACECECKCECVSESEGEYVIDSHGVRVCARAHVCGRV